MGSRRTPPGRRSRPGSTFPVFPIALGVVILGFVIGAAIAAMRHGGGTAVALTTAAPSAAQPATATQAPSAVQVATDAPPATQAPTDAPTHAPSAAPTMAAVADASPSPAPQATSSPAASPAPSASAAVQPAPQRVAATQAPAHPAGGQHAVIAAQLQQAIAMRNAPPPPPTPVGSHGLIATTASTHVTMSQPEPPPPPPPQPVDQGATADPNAQLLHDAQDAVRTYIGAIAAGDDATAKAQLLANSGTSQATLLEKSFLDPGARIVDMSARATSPTTAVIDADIQTQKGLYYGHFEVRRLDSGIVLISLHSAVKA